jgi:hypothetical protein
VKNVRFVYDNTALPDLVLLCLGEVQVGNQLFTTLPTETEITPSFTVEKISGEIMVARRADNRRGKIQFRCLTASQWNERFD